MKSNLKIENYPLINNKTIDKYLNIINKNRANWDDPFFSDTQTYIDFNKISQALEKIELEG